MYLGTVNIDVDAEDVLDQISDKDIERYLVGRGMFSKKIETPSFEADEKEFIQFIYDYMKHSLKMRRISFSEKDFIDELTEFIKDHYYLIDKENKV